MNIWHESEMEKLFGALLCNFSIESVAEMLDRDEDDVRTQIARLGYSERSVESLH
jgi:hypothetical protein